jgi:hypothetical protein
VQDPDPAALNPPSLPAALNPPNQERSPIRFSQTSWSWHSFQLPPLWA